jgi:protein-tyrosine phosphatase
VSCACPPVGLSEGAASETRREDAAAALFEAWRRAETNRVEVACGAGRGRTGTAVACITVLDGVAAPQAVAYVRELYDPRAVETPWQRQYVERFLTTRGSHR